MGITGDCDVPNCFGPDGGGTGICVANEGTTGRAHTSTVSVVVENGFTFNNDCGYLGVGHPGSVPFVSEKPGAYGRLLLSMCDIPWHRAFPRNPFIINISMYFGATEKWHAQMVMVSRVVQLAGALDAPSGTRVSNRPVYAVILVMPDV